MEGIDWSASVLVDTSPALVSDTMLGKKHAAELLQTYNLAELEKRVVKTDGKILFVINQNIIGASSGFFLRLFEDISHRFGCQYDAACAYDVIFKIDDKYYFRNFVRGYPILYPPDDQDRRIGDIAHCFSGALQDSLPPDPGMVRRDNRWRNPRATP